MYGVQAEQGENASSEDEVEEIQIALENDIYMAKPQNSKLPMELIAVIIVMSVDYLKIGHLTICKSLYHLLKAELYSAPVLNARNFKIFTEAISTGSQKRELGSFVKELDLSNIIQTGKNSFVSKVLRRCCSNLKVFVAPQTSFGYAPLIALRSCSQLEVLDLRLVSETINLKELFQAIKNSQCLKELSFPRSSISCEGYETIEWPKNLWYLRISGGISDDFLQSHFPSTITSLEFAHCPSISEGSMYQLFADIGENITHLSIHYPMRGLPENAMDMLFRYCHNLTFLFITVDYVTKDLFDEEYLPVEPAVPLKTLWIECSGMLGQSAKIHPDDITIALMEERLPRLMNLQFSCKLGWNLASNDVQDLVGVVQERGGSVYVV